MNTNKKEKFINKNNAVHKRFWQIGIRTFFVFLFVIAFIGLLLPLRPKRNWRSVNFPNSRNQLFLPC